MTDSRSHRRCYLQQYARGGILHRGWTEFTPRLNFKPVIKDISFGGMGLILFSPIGQQSLELLQNGKSNLFIEFNLPPSLKTMGITGKVKWVKKKNYLQTPFTTLGIEFINKTQELYREIDKFFKIATTQSELNPNRRFFPRIPVQLRTDYTIDGILNWGLFPKVFRADVLNLSALGISIKTITPLKEKELKWLIKRPQQIKLKFFVDYLNRFVHTNARAIYFNPGSLSQSVILGMKFINLPERDQSMLVEYLSLKRHLFIKEDISFIENTPTLQTISA
ncbi:MAG: PilZ domain-containing protein [Candidatus Aureabacteria bacterium]|nr:PilZ domain-containing protein [Candidatus Auribacterota bacterium]